MTFYERYLSRIAALDDAALAAGNALNEAYAAMLAHPVDSEYADAFSRAHDRSVAIAERYNLLTQLHDDDVTTLVEDID